MPKVKVINPGTSEIVLKTDVELLNGSDLRPQERARRLKAIMKAKTSLLVPEMIEVIADHARGPNPKISLEAAKYLVDRGLGTADKEVADDPTSKKDGITDAEIEEVLGGTQIDDSE